MEIKFWLNGKLIEDTIEPDTPLLEYVRSKGCLSVKRGCETSNCGLCTLWIDEKPVLSCTVLAVRANGKKVTTLEGLQDEAYEFGKFMAGEGADQCGYCNPGFIMNVLAMARELKEFSDEDIKEYLVGNLCRCTGYMGQFRAVKKYLDYKMGGKK
ncbi:MULTISPECIES: (2Fe-2S)-binding protein [Fusobacterium]|uniref:(2Fe-2S)-binding protein n=1 Tax=Fusobacterium TaxID=848 RepID=UPI001F30F713|nr:MULTISPECIES: 2Fe-2S iron-sulfur cluster-binding protein [Fusobacterium]MCF2612431.1 (2Fe-2S)-binding protein [Fusobacterium perfoetens]MDY2980621.1 2Fe-2S iron-sulfur cluster-binding protein [Fusobacterium sp.]